METSDKVAIVLLPVTDPLIEYMVYGFFEMQHVLTIPSTQLVWTESRDFNALLDERFPCDDHSFTRFRTMPNPRNLSEATKRDLHPCVIHARANAVVFRNPAWNSNSDNKPALDSLYKAAKKSPVVLVRDPYINRMRTGFVKSYEQDAKGNSWNVLRFDRTKWEEQQARKKKRTAESATFPRGSVTVRELKVLVLSMELTLRAGLESALIKDSYFRIDVVYARRIKKEICASIINIYEVGKTAYGKTFWTKARAGMNYWSGNAYKVVHTAKDIADRWKKEKPAAPKDKQAKKVAAIIKEIAKAKPFKKGVGRHTYRLYR